MMLRVKWFLWDAARNIRHALPGAGKYAIMFTSAFCVFVFMMQSMGRSEFACYVNGLSSAECFVDVDGKIVGKTPAIVNLGFGRHRVAVYSPKGVQTTPAYVEWPRQMYPFMGHLFRADFWTPPPDPAVLVLCRIDGKDVAGCVVKGDDGSVGWTPHVITLKTMESLVVEVIVPAEVQTKQSSKYVRIARGTIRDGQVVASFASE